MHDFFVTIAKDSRFLSCTDEIIIFRDVKGKMDNDGALKLHF